MPIERGLRTERIAVNCYAETFERLQGIIPSSRKKLPLILQQFFRHLNLMQKYLLSISITENPPPITPLESSNLLLG